MKANRLTCLALWLAVAAASAPVGTAQAAAESSQPEKFKKGAERLAAGQAAAPEARRQREAERSPGPAEEMERRQVLKRELEELRAHLKELVSAGKRDEAAEVKERVAQMERKLKDSSPPEARAPRKAPSPRVPGEPPAAVGPGPRRPGQPREGAEGARMERPFRERAPGRVAERQETQRRLQHLQVAIENLRAAGLPEPAERLAQQAQELHQRLEGSPRFMEPGPERPLGQLRELRAEIEELRQAVQELRRRLEDLSRERR